MQQPQGQRCCLQATRHERHDALACVQGIAVDINEITSKHPAQSLAQPQLIILLRIQIPE